jgi:hypothetical protein
VRYGSVRRQFTKLKSGTVLALRFSRAALLILGATMSWRDKREAELRQLRQSDPVRLLAMYRNLAGLSVDTQLPHGVSITGMITALLDAEERQRQVDPLHDEMTG